MPPESACIIGGGFYGVVIALYLKRLKGIAAVTLFERESDLLSRASFVNQARVHGGYHYPRSFTTAYRSRENIHRFASDWSQCIDLKMLKYYALAKRNSKVTAQQFTRVCEQIGAPLEMAEPEICHLFNPALIAAVYRAEEYAFDANKLRAWSHAQLLESAVSCHLCHTVVDASPDPDGGIQISVRDPAGQITRSRYSLVFNCTYSGLSQVLIDEPSSALRLKHEIAELVLVEPPPELESIGVTVMDGPFFSLMPFPAKNCHSLSHVRYTPHAYWFDHPGLSPYAVLDQATRETRVDRMIRDASRYLPVVARSRYRESLFEVKTVLEKNESDDGRPILFRESLRVPCFYSVLGGKIDNIYDILESIDKLPALQC
ncbi:MAG: FAD-dependent oxidoreductase [Cyanobacteriota bacterium]|nr:FAD-dependent oxidoreductase [Cyanobacteriota bacterium]